MDWFKNPNNTTASRPEVPYIRTCLDCRPKLINVARRYIATASTIAALSLTGSATLMVTQSTHAEESPNADLAFDTEDLDFILKQIEFAERHAKGEKLVDILPNSSIPWGLRTVDGSFNNLNPGQTEFGQADLEFKGIESRVFRDAKNGTSYNSHETVIDTTPRLISHLIVNQSTTNPAAVFAANEEGGEKIEPDISGHEQFFIPNTAPDEGLSAPINAFMTFFGQFFDHGLDLINKGGNGVVLMPVPADDPLFVEGGMNMMVMPRASQQAGPDGIQGTSDDIHSFINATTPHVDQQQTYASHASAQVLLRHYEVGPSGSPQSSGRLLNGFGADRILDTSDDGGMATWDTAQAQGLLKLGLDLDDQDGNNIPMIMADPYGNFIPGDNGLPQLVTAVDENGVVTGTLEGDLENPVDASLALRVNHSFFIDVAHSAAPNGTPDDDTVINARTDMLSGQVTRGIRESAPEGSYDDELLGAHFICGDGRCNENIALTTIHTIFHSEHNRLIDVTRRVLLDAGDLPRLNAWLHPDNQLDDFPTWQTLPFRVSDATLANQATTHAAIEALDLNWHGERLFQAGRFGTEMQYNRIVFDEFAPTLAGLKDDFEGFHNNVDPSISLEFAQSVYRFGHSMLTETVDRYDPDFNTITDPGALFPGASDQLGLFEAFLNPLAWNNANAAGEPTLTPEEAAGAIIRGLTRTTANEIDEFVTGAMQNNLVGLPLDLGAINIARGRDVGNPGLNQARRKFFAATQDTRLKPYAHWADYADNIRHELSLVNFIAAYGTHPLVAGEDGIIGTADDLSMTYAERRVAACAIVGALTPDSEAYCIDKGFADGPGPITTPSAEALAAQIAVSAATAAAAAEASAALAVAATAAAGGAAIAAADQALADAQAAAASTAEAATAAQATADAAAQTATDAQEAADIALAADPGGLGTTVLATITDTADGRGRLRLDTTCPANSAEVVSDNSSVQCNFRGGNRVRCRGVNLGANAEVTVSCLSGLVSDASILQATADAAAAVAATAAATADNAATAASAAEASVASAILAATSAVTDAQAANTAAEAALADAVSNSVAAATAAEVALAAAIAVGDVVPSRTDPLPTPDDALAFLFSSGEWASIDGITTTGLDDVDFWNGGLAEERMPFGGYLGSTHNFVFETQIESLQNGDRFYYVARTANIHLFSELESNSFTALVMRNTNLGLTGGGSLSLNIFSVPNHILEVDQDEQFDAAGDGTSADPEGDAELVALVIRNPGALTTNIHIPDGTRVVQYTGGDHVTIGGTDGADTIIGGIGDDSLYGRAGDDRIEGGDGADLIEGGSGDDIITDLSGPDVIEGGSGHDAISSGNEEDVIFGDDGNDFIVNSSEFGEIFGGLGDDYIFDGFHNGHIRGGAGNDWMENQGGGEDLWQADNGAAPEAGEPPIKGHDVFIAHDGNNDADMENGDDIIVDGPGIDRAEGQLGFDWISFANDPLGVSVDLDLSIFDRPMLPPSNATVQNRYDRVEGISGSPFADLLRGTPNSPGADRGNELTEPNMALIEGLSALIPLSERRELLPDVISGEPQFGWTNGEIILGGGGSDLMVGEGGNDILDGDASLKVMISTPNPVIRSGPLGVALRDAKAAARKAASQAILDSDAVNGFFAATVAAQAAVDAATEAAATALLAAGQLEAAQVGLSTMTVKDAIGNLITASTTSYGITITDAWQDFLDACSQALVDLGFDMSTAEHTRVEAFVAQAEAIAAQQALTLASVEATAVASSAAVADLETAVVIAQAALDAVDETVLVASMLDIMEAVFAGLINPGELEISRVISLDDVGLESYDSALYSGNVADYSITFPTADMMQVEDNRSLPANVDPGRPGNDGRDLLRNVERLLFGDAVICVEENVIVDCLIQSNIPAAGQPTISGTPDVGLSLTASIAGVTDADNITDTNPTGAITTMVDWFWQSELEPGSNFFQPIARLAGANGNGDPFEVHGETIMLTAAESGLRVRVLALFQDDDMVFEMVTSDPVQVSGDIVMLGDPTVTLDATFRSETQRLRANGTASLQPGDMVTLFIGTTTDNMTCDGTPLANLEIDVDFEFLFDTGPGFGAAPGELCIQSDDLGLAASALVVSDALPPGAPPVDLVEIGLAASNAATIADLDGLSVGFANNSRPGVPRLDIRITDVSIELFGLPAAFVAGETAGCDAPTICIGDEVTVVGFTADFFTAGGELIRSFGDDLVEVIAQPILDANGDPVTVLGVPQAEQDVLTVLFSIRFGDVTPLVPGSSVVVISLNGVELASASFTGNSAANDAVGVTITSVQNAALTAIDETEAP